MEQKFFDYLSFNKKRILINYSIFISIAIIFLIIDLVTKQTLFEWNGNQGKNQIDGEFRYKNWFFGVRSISNSGLTFLGNWLPTWLVHVLNIIMLLLISFFMLILKSKAFSISLGMLFSGTLGNMIDRMVFGVVRDIIFLPWMDKGTFNFADVFATIGSISTLIILIYQTFFGSKTPTIKHNNKIVKNKEKKKMLNNNEPLLIVKLPKINKITTFI